MENNKLITVGEKIFKKEESYIGAKYSYGYNIIVKNKLTIDVGIKGKLLIAKIIYEIIKWDEIGLNK